MIETTNTNGAWHTNLLVANDKSFSKGEVRNFLLENCNLFDSNIDGYKESEQKLILEITFPSKETDKCPYVISTPSRITNDGCAIGAVGGARYFSEQRKNEIELEDAIFLISRTRKGMEDLLNHIDSIKNIQDMTKGTNLYIICNIFKNFNKENETILKLYEDAFTENGDTKTNFYRDSKVKVNKDIIPYLPPNKKLQVIEQIQDTQEQARNWSDSLRENMIIKTQDNISIKKIKLKLNAI